MLLLEKQKEQQSKTLNFTSACLWPESKVSNTLSSASIQVLHHTKLYLHPVQSILQHLCQHLPLKIRVGRSAFVVRELVGVVGVGREAGALTLTIGLINMQEKHVLYMRCLHLPVCRKCQCWPLCEEEDNVLLLRGRISCTAREQCSFWGIEEDGSSWGRTNWVGVKIRSVRRVKIATDSPAKSCVPSQSRQPDMVILGSAPTQKWAQIQEDSLVQRLHYPR